MSSPHTSQQWFSASGSRLLSSCITTSVLSVQGQLVVYSRALRPSAEPTTRDERLAWSCILARYGAHGYCFCTCYCYYVCEFGGGEQRRGKCRRRCAGLPLNCLHVKLGMILWHTFLQASELLYLRITFSLALSVVSCWIKSMSKLLISFTRTGM